MDMVRENNIISKLNGYANNGVILRDISVRNIKPIRLTVKIVADGTLDKGQLDIIKDDIERLVGEKVELEVTVALKVH